MPRFKLEDAPDPAELELGAGHVFVVQELTKHLESKLEPIQSELNEKLARARNGAALVAVIGKYFDVVLKRVDAGEGTGQAKPSTLLKKAWDGNKLSVERLMFLYRVVEGSGLEGPPT